MSGSDPAGKNNADCCNITRAGPPGPARPRSYNFMKYLNFAIPFHCGNDHAQSPLEGEVSLESHKQADRVRVQVKP
jgi:hypothetical protein